MLWFIVWAVLVVAALAVVALLGLRLWRSGRELVRALGRAGDVLERLSVQIDDLTAAAEASRPSTAPTLLTDRGELRERREALRGQARARRAVRAVRHAATRERWRSYSR